MFDVFDGTPRQTRPITPVVLSIAGHVLLLALVVVAPLLYATNRLPQVPSMMAFVATAPQPPPPPPPPPPAPAPERRPTPKASDIRQPLPTPAFAAPVEAPSDIRPEAPSLVADARTGVEGGVVGGVQGGIVGGLVTAPPPPPPPPPPAQAKPVRIGGNIQSPQLLKRVEPTYPDIALIAKVSGLVVLEASVNADGSVVDVRVLRSVKLLDQAAIDAVRQWRYQPLVLNGVPTPFVLSVTLNFRMKES